GDDDQRRCLLLVPHSRVIDAHLVAAREVASPRAFHSGHQSVAQANVAELSAHHDLVIPTPRAKTVELGRRYGMFHEVFSRRRIDRDAARGGDMIGGDRVAQQGKNSCPVMSAGGSWRRPDSMK